MILLCYAGALLLAALLLGAGAALIYQALAATRAHRRARETSLSSDPIPAPPSWALRVGWVLGAELMLMGLALLCVIAHALVVLTTTAS
jgi:hypothetical protein